MSKKVLKFKNKQVGTLEIKNSTENENAKLYFYGDIVSDSWQSYWYDEDKCPQDILDFLNEIDDNKPIDIYINSGGGSVSAGLAIYNQLKRHTGTKTVHVDGIAASIASVIALAGDTVVIPSTAQFMIHKPWTCGTGNSDDFRQLADALDSCEKAILNVYMANAKEGVTEEQIKQLMKEETWFTGDKAEEYFNIQVEEGTECVATTSDYFNKYKNIPKSFIPKNDKNKGKENLILKNKLQAQLDLMCL